MTEHEKYQEHIRHTHDAFCKTVIRHAAIDAALSALSQMEQEIIFLYYFQRLTHREIGRRYGRAGNTTGRRIQMILRRLRAELEGLSYPIMRDMSALVRKWTDRLTRICRSISSGN